MSFGRPLPSQVRRPSMGAPGMSGTHSPALVTRVNEKKAELANLKELRDLSAQLASQMEMLENKLATLADGTQAIAVVLSNWHNVLGAIQMASMKIPRPKDADTEMQDDQQTHAPLETPLPQTLVRIPIQNDP